jgi:L,D-transpeptidase catalytic domain
LTSHINLEFVPVDYRLRELAMRRSSAIVMISLGAAVVASDAEAKLDLFIDKSTQQISVIQNGRLLYVWPVSTGQDRFSTPSGVYAPERLERTWFSRAYYNSPMPYAIFFHNGYAIHGSYDIARLGGPASHGCIRLHPQDAAMLYGMVAQEGPGNTTIVVGGGGSPNPVPPRYGDFDESLRPLYRRDGAIARGPYPPGQATPPYYDYPAGPQTPPYYNADPYADGPARRGGDNSQVPTRAPYPANRRPTPRLDAQASVDPTLGLRGSYRLPATAKSNSKCATCSPNRAADELSNHHISASEAAPSPPPAPPPMASLPPASPPPPTPATAPSPPEQQQPSTGYKVLPRSYWAGAAWRWRLKAEHEITGVQSPAPDSQ